MKKWIWALVTGILVWNVILSVQLINLSKSGTRTGTTTTVENEVNNYTTEVTKTAEDAQISVVSVYAATENSEKVASGVIYASVDDDIYIFTTAEIADGATSLTIRFDSGAQMSGEVVGIDKITGLSLLKCTPDFNTSAIKLGDSFVANEGEFVIAVGGRRKDTESSTISFGIISTPGQRNTNTSSYWITSIIETSAEVNSTIVGGPLLNVGGEMIGILINRPTGSSTDMGYAVGINEVKQLYASFSKNGSITRGSLGVVTRSVRSLESYQKSERGLRLDSNTGVIVSSILEGSPAEGVFEEGDVLLSMDGATIQDSDDLMVKLYDHVADDTVSITFSREGKENTVSVVLK